MEGMGKFFLLLCLLVQASQAFTIRKTMKTACSISENGHLVCSLKTEPHRRAKRGLSLDPKLKEKALDLIEHFKQDDPIGVPGLPIEDPMPIPDMSQGFSGVTINFQNLKIHGTSKFRLEHARADLTALQMSVGVNLEVVEVLGRYSMSSWISSSRGDCNITILDVYGEGVANLEVDQEGKLRAQDIDMDIKFTDMKMTFDNLGFFGKIFQGIVNSVGAFVFDSIKPMVLGQVNDQIQGTVNQEMRNLPILFPNSIAPIDVVISEGRKMIKELGLDPYELPPYSTDSWLKIQLQNGKLLGLSTLHRTGNVTVGYAEKTGHLTVSVGTNRVRGSYDWSIGTALYTRSGRVEFSLENFELFLIVSQPANLDKKPVLEDLQVKLGNMRLTSQGAGSLDYILEFLFNVAPNILRKQIMDVLEIPIRMIVQQHMDKMDIQAIIKQVLATL